MADTHPLTAAQKRENALLVQMVGIVMTGWTLLSHQLNEEHRWASQVEITEDVRDGHPVKEKQT